MTKRIANPGRLRRALQNQTPLEKLDPKTEQDLSADELLARAGNKAVNRDHTPSGWLPRNQRPSYDPDERRDRRRIV